MPSKQNKNYFTRKEIFKFNFFFFLEVYNHKPGLNYISISYKNCMFESKREKLFIFAENNILSTFIQVVNYRKIKRKFTLIPIPINILLQHFNSKHQ